MISEVNTAAMRSNCIYYHSTFPPYNFVTPFIVIIIYILQLRTQLCSTIIISIRFNIITTDTITGTCIGLICRVSRISVPRKPEEYRYFSSCA